MSQSIFYNAALLSYTFRIFMCIIWLRSNRDVLEYGSLTFSGNAFTCTIVQMAVTLSFDYGRKLFRTQKSFTPSAKTH